MNSNVCPECGGYKSAKGMRCAHCARSGGSTAREPLYCTCPHPDVDGLDMCRVCLRANREAVYNRHGWKLEEQAS